MRHLFALVAVLIAAPAAAQLGLPGVALPQLPGPAGTVDRTLDSPVETLRRSADRLLDLRAGRIERLLRQY
jgi:hypothetical protein